MSCTQTNPVRASRDTTGSPRQAVGVIDLGSSWVKLLVMPLHEPGSGQTLGAWRSPVIEEGSGQSILDMAGIDDILSQAMRALAGFHSADGGNVSLLAITGQVGGCVLLDHLGRPTGEALTWADARCSPQARQLAEAFAGRFEMSLGHHLPLQTCWLAPKLRYLREAHRELCDQVAMVLTPPAYVFYRLTGQYGATPDLMISLAHQWDNRLAEPIVHWTGWRENQFPPMHRALPRASLKGVWGKLADGMQHCQVVLSGADMLCGMHGLAMEPSQAFIQCGTTEIAGMVVPVTHEAASPQAIVKLPWAIDGGREMPSSTPSTPGHQVIYGSTNNGGASLAWLEKRYGIDTADVQLWQDARQLCPQADGPIFIPHIGGARSPHWRTGTWGGFIGPVADLPAARLLRVVLEGCAMNKLAVLEATRWRGESVIVAGGGARQAVANQIRADILGASVRVCQASEVTALGAAYKAITASGMLTPSQARAWLQSIHHQQGQTMVKPDVARGPVYQQLRQRYLAYEQQALACHESNEQEEVFCKNMH